jgi:hypothetical protein
VFVAVFWVRGLLNKNMCSLTGSMQLICHLLRLGTLQDREQKALGMFTTGQRVYLLYRSADSNWRCLQQLLSKLLRLGTLQDSAAYMTRLADDMMFAAVF